MNVKLREALRLALADWKNEVPAKWRVLKGIPLGFESRAFDREVHAGEIIIPGRKGKVIPHAPAGAHIFRALGRLAPAEVRAIILGQEPYPHSAWATGRAFEQGDLIEWPQNSKLIAPSLRRIVQVIAHARTGKHAYVSSDRGWKHLIQDLQSGVLALEPAQRLFDYLEDQGVLFPNASLTVSVSARSGQMERRCSHFPLWKPLLDRTLSSIAARKNGHAVFLLCGRHSVDLFERAGARSAAESAGNWHKRIDLVTHCHPAAITTKGAAFLLPPNPLLVANRVLKRMGAKPIQW